MSVGIVFILVLAMLLVIFTLQNSMLIDIKLLFWQISDVPLVLALIICVLIGFLAAMMIYYPRIWKLKSTIKEQQKQLTKLTETLSQQDNHPEGIEMTGGSEKGFFTEED